MKFSLPSKQIFRILTPSFLPCLLLFCAFLLLTVGGRSQDSSNELVKNHSQAPLFDGEDILDLTLRGDTRSLFRDRGTNPAYHPMEISYVEADGRTVTLPLKVKTRGNFRRQRSNCFYPPLLLNFPKSKVPDDCLFAGQNKIKLVTPCRGEEYVVREFLVYKLYNLLTEKSFRARLIRVTYEATKKGKDTEPLYGILLEDEDQMAKRNDSRILKRNGVRPDKTDPASFLPMAVFEYMIGNTDWSVQFRHNVKLLPDENTRMLATVPYDFDHAGIVNTPYARPAPALKMRSIRERRYRGYCLEDPAELEPVLARFNELREDFYRVYTECLMLDEKYIRNTIEWLDEFYETINDPEAVAKAFSYPCDERGTGNVVIKGLRGSD